jgi:peptidoglycan/xylan/chitin deacetylase (PgdA/CDA1 family)
MLKVVKSTAEIALCRSGLTRASRRRLRDATVVLAYHNIVPDGESARGDRSLHLPQREFARQLDLIGRTHDVVPLESLEETTTVSSRRPRAVITFDDACQGAVTVGVDELARRGLPATIFVAPAFVGGGSFWWDAVAGAGGLDDAVRGTALSVLRGEDARVRAWAREQGLPLQDLPAHQTVASEEQLAAATRSGGITLASHTWSHPNLARLEMDELEGELVRPLAWLRERFDAVIPWLTYPYGLHSPTVERAAEKAGYAGALRVEGGIQRGPTRRDYRLPRVNVPAGISIRGFELRTSGILNA